MKANHTYHVTYTHVSKTNLIDRMPTGRTLIVYIAVY